MQITPTSLKDIASLINAEIIGSENHIITGFNEIHCVKAGDVVFVDHPKYYEKALQSAATTILMNNKGFTCRAIYFFINKDGCCGRL